jgi:hypothetical protein
MSHALRITSLVLAVTALTLFAAGCQSSSEKGVTSDYHAQWTNVNADTRATTEAAKAVFTEEGLKDISGSSTNVDGTASGKKSDGTKVNAAIERKGDNLSQVSVSVGTMGDPALGANIARKIKDKAEGH